MMGLIFCGDGGIETASEPLNNKWTTRLFYYSQQTNSKLISGNLQYRS